MASQPTHRTIHDISAIAIVKTVAILALVWVIWVLKDLVLVVIVAIIIASAIEPGVRWLMRRGLPRVVSVIMHYALLAAVFTLLFYFLIVPLGDEAVNLVKELPEYLGGIDAGTAAVPADGSLVSSITRSFSLQELAGQLNSALANLSRGFLSTLSTVFGGVLSFLLIIVLSFYLSVQDRGIAKFLTAIAPLKHRGYVLNLWGRSEAKIGKWMQGQLLLAAIVFILVYIGLLLFRVKHALLLATLAGLFEIIPMFGPILAAIPGVLLAFVDGGLSTAVFVTLLYILVQQLENQVIYPLVVRKVIGVPPIISILAIIAGGKLLGFLGIVISVPVAAVLMEYWNDIQKDRDAEEVRQNGQ